MTRQGSGRMPERKIFKKLGIQKQALQLFSTSITENKELFTLDRGFTESEFEKIKPNLQTNFEYYELLKEVCENTDVSIDNFGYSTRELLPQLVYNTKYSQTTNPIVLMLLMRLEAEEERVRFYRYIRVMSHAIENRTSEGIPHFEDIVAELISEGKLLFSDKESMHLYNHWLALKFMDDVSVFYIQNAESMKNALSFFGREKANVAVEKIVNYHLETGFSRASKEQIYDVWRKGYQISEQDFKSMYTMFFQLYEASYPKVIENRAAVTMLSDEEGFITVYRGYTNESTPINEAMSWTVSLNVAASFAYRYANADYYSIAKGRVRIEDVYDAFLIGNELVKTELEVLVNPANVEIVDEVRVGGFDTILAGLEETYQTVSLPFVTENDTNYLAIAHDAIKELEKLDSYFNPVFVVGDDHGMEHTKRVIVNTLAILSLYDATIEMEDIEICTVAAMIHDIGRVNDWEDTVHGRYSMERIKTYTPTMYELSSEASAIVEFIVTYHCIDDEEAKVALEESAIVDKARAWFLYSVVCDADGLDRVRFKDLDVRYIRNKEAKLLVPFAVTLLKAKL